MPASNLTIKNCYRVSVDSAGYMAEHSARKDGRRRFGWDMDRLGPSLATAAYPWQNRNLVVATSLGLFIGKDLLDTLRIYPDANRYIRMGTGRKLWPLNEDMTRQMRERIENPYPPRSDREAECDRRNAEICRWLLWLAKNATVVATA
jgi:hypothetical protein